MSTKPEVTSEGKGDVPEENQAERLRILTAAAEATVEKESAEVVKTMNKTEKTVRPKNAKVHKPAAKIDSNTANNAETTENTSFQSEPLSDELSLDAVPVPRKERETTLPTENDLRVERERVQKVKVAEEMLSAGWSVRETSQQLKIPKSLTERLSKRINSSPRGGYRQQYLERPYQRALEGEGDEEDLVEWARREQVKIDKMAIQRDMMRRNGLLGSNAESTAQRIDINSILIAKALGGNNNGGNKELIELVKTFKELGFLGSPQTDTFLEKYAAMENIKNMGIEKYKEVQASAYKQAQESASKGILSQAIEQFAPALTNLTKSLGQVKIPNPTPLAPEIPGPMAIDASDLQALGRQGLQVPEGQILDLGLPESIGYSNLDALRGKTKLQEG